MTPGHKREALQIRLEPNASHPRLLREPHIQNCKFLPLQFHTGFPGPFVSVLVHRTPWHHYVNPSRAEQLRMRHRLPASGRTCVGPVEKTAAAPEHQGRNGRAEEWPTHVQRFTFCTSTGAQAHRRTAAFISLATREHTANCSLHHTQFFDVAKENVYLMSPPQVTRFAC